MSWSQWSRSTHHIASTFDDPLRLVWDLDFLSLEPRTFKPLEAQSDHVAMAEEELTAERIPPGFTRGLVFDATATVPRFSVAAFLHNHEQEQERSAPVADDETAAAIEQFTFVHNARTDTHPTRLSFARQVNLQQILEDYDQTVPELAHPFPFELDAFQKQAIYHLERGESVFVAAHTSAGKTVVAEYAIALAQKHMTKAVYTSPIKALSNQKFRDFHETFESVGLLTGDIQLNPDASCLIMTTEILRSMLYRGAALVQDVEFVIFDEVHYVNDQDRGVVWEEVIIMLPPHVTIIMLSATTPNNLEFADWVGRTRKCEIFVISTLRRPVPLEHFLFTNRLETAGGKTSVHRKELFKVVDAGRVFDEQAYRAALQSLQSLKDRERPTGGERRSITATPASTPAFRNINQERSLWTDVVYMLEKRALLPAVAFTFSKRKCDENADSLNNIDLNTASERSAVHIFLATSLAKLQGDDAELPQITWLRSLLGRGIGVHHSGLLPLMKEAVEMLFSRGLVKVLFATETFAMGVNMPARTVVFSSLRKHDGTGFRFLHPGEYTQMAGRAGRRGKDSTGTVIILCPEQVPNDTTLRQTILGQPTRLVSQFRLTYQMILSLLRIESLRVEEMLKRSFSENISQRAQPEQEAQMAQDQALLSGLTALDCAICAVDLEECYATGRAIAERSERIFRELLAGPQRLAERTLPLGTVVVVDAGPQARAVPAVVLRIITERDETRVLCAVGAHGDSHAHDCVFPPNRVNLLPRQSSTQLRTVAIAPRDLVRITQTRLAISPTCIAPTSTQVALKDAPVILAELAQVSEDALLAEAKFPQFSTSAGGFEIDECVIVRRQLLARLSAFTCNRCPDLVQHYSMMHKKRTLTERLAQLQFQLSDSSLHLLPEYEARVRLLQRLDYVDAAHMVLIKGRVACEINTVDPLILTELLFENAFVDCSAGEVAAVLAGLVFQDRSALSSAASPHDASENVETMLQRLLLSNDEVECQDASASAASPPAGDYLISATPAIYRACRRLVRLTSVLATHQRDCGLAHLPCGSPLTYLQSTFNPALIRTVYEWTRGTSFLTLTTDVTSISEGSIVRCMTRLDESCREVAGAGKIMGDHVLVTKMEEAARLIRRDICFTSSLYL